MVLAQRLLYEEHDAITDDPDGMSRLIAAIKLILPPLPGDNA